MDRRLYFTHKCRICNYMFVTERDLLVHEAAHDQPEFLCYACHEVFQDGAQLTAHAELGCHSPTDDPGGSKQRRVCKACGEVFDAVNDLYKHYVEKHLEHDDGSAAAKRRCLDTSPEMCATCGASFSCRASLKVHAWKSHGTAAHQQMSNAVTSVPSCSLGGGSELVTTMSSKSRRLVASRMTAAADKPFKCSMCNWAFKYDFSLRAHMKIHDEKRRELFRMLKAGKLVSTIMNGAIASNSSATGASGIQTPLVGTNIGTKNSVVYLRVKRNTTLEDGIHQSHTVDALTVADSAEGKDHLKEKGVSAELRTRCLISGSEQITKLPAGFQEALPSLHSIEMQRNNGFVYCDAQSVASVASLVASDPVHTFKDEMASDDDDCSDDDDDEPRHYVCKLCNFTCRYDFSYVAHLSQHDKLKELDIVDIQAHLVAAGVGGVDGVASPIGEPENGFVFEGLADAGEFTIRMMNDSGDVTYLQPSQVAGGINYVLVRAEDGGAPGLPENGDLHEVISGFDYETCKEMAASSGEDVIFVDGSTVNDLQQCSLEMSAVEVEESATVDHQLHLSSTDGVNYYGLPSQSVQSGTSTDCTELEQFIHPVCREEISYGDNVAHFDSSYQVVDCDAGTAPCVFVSENDSSRVAEADSEVGAETMTCYFCNASFVCKSRLEAHMVEMHVD